MSCRRLTVEDMCFGSGLRAAEVNSLPVNLNPNFEPLGAPIARRATYDAFQAGRAVRSYALVLHVLASRRIAQVAEAVIGAVKVYMVDVINRVSAGHHLPDDTRYLELGLVDADDKVSIRAELADWLFGAVAPQPARRRIVIVPAAQERDVWYRLEIGHGALHTSALVKWRRSAETLRRCVLPSMENLAHASS